MTFANNPQAYFNGFISVSRNVFLTSSIAVALYGYSNSFKIGSSVNIVKLFSISIILFAMLYAINGIIGMTNYIRILEKSEGVPNYVQLNIWRNYVYLLGFYAFFLFMLSLVAMRRLKNNVFK